MGLANHLPKPVALLMLCFLLAHFAKAQQLVLVDDEGNKVALAAVLNENGDILGYSGIDGELPDLKDSKKLFISHVAYLPVEVDIADIKDGKVVMKMADIAMHEVVVSPKPIVCVRKYYRFYLCLNSKMLYYRCGLVDYYFDKRTRKQSHEKLAKGSFSRAPFGTILNMMPWAYAFEIEDTTEYLRLKQNTKFAFEKDSPSLERISCKGITFGTASVNEARSQVQIVQDMAKLDSIQDKMEERKNSRYSICDENVKSVSMYSGTDPDKLLGEDLLYKALYGKMSGIDTKKDRNVKAELSLVEYVIDVTPLTEQEAKARRKEKFPKMDSNAIEEVASSKGVPQMDNKSTQLLLELKKSKH